ncbi:MAG: ATP-dependent metallopeptidase FtsH/Yme1/Tma family protein [Lentisphaeraceae bacterium]|nr:ATP-dependent metallopeptidase FtsH/Yme1/Tma family protein [Lentisphaeraceae bacterium]
MKHFFLSLTVLSSLFFFSCRAQDVIITYNDFKNMIEKKEVDKVVFHKGTNMVTIIHDGTSVDYEHNMDIAEGRSITRLLTKKNIIYKTKTTSSD